MLIKQIPNGSLLFKGFVYLPTALSVPIAILESPQATVSLPNETDSAPLEKARYPTAVP